MEKLRTRIQPLRAYYEIVESFGMFNHYLPKWNLRNWEKLEEIRAALSSQAEPKKETP